MRTLVLGASLNPSRYSYKATEQLIKREGEPPFLIGSREGVLWDCPIQVGTPELKEIDTVTIYLSEARQLGYTDYLINVLKPRRIIFNPGAENPILAEYANAAGIEVLQACTLVLLATGQY